MTYLVTGGTGFIGSHVVRRLLENSDRVIAFDLTPDRELLEKIIGSEGMRQVVIVPGDVLQIDALVQTCQDYGVTKIIHAAAIIGSQNPPLTVQVNCDGTINVLETARRLGLGRVVLTSSVAVFGPPEKYSEEYIPTDAPHFPMTIYGACKSFDESCARVYITEHGLDLIVIRLPHVFGLGRKRGIGRTVDDELLVKPVALGLPGRVPFGEGVHNWLYVEDAARALVIASQVGATRPCAFTASGDVRSTAEVAAYIKSLVPRADITLLPGRFNHPFKFDAAPIKDQLGFQPEWSLERAFAFLVDRLQNEHGIRRE